MARGGRWPPRPDRCKVCRPARAAAAAPPDPRAPQTGRGQCRAGSDAHARMARGSPARDVDGPAPLLAWSLPPNLADPRVRMEHVDRLVLELPSERATGREHLRAKFNAR